MGGGVSDGYTWNKKNWKEYNFSKFVKLNWAHAISFVFLFCPRGQFFVFILVCASYYRVPL